MRTSTCPKCDGRMEPGYILDRSSSVLRQSRWVEGEPAPSFWTHLSVQGHPQLPVTTLRCTRCGFLESWAEAD